MGGSEPFAIKYLFDGLNIHAGFIDPTATIGPSLKTRLMEELTASPGQTIGQLQEALGVGRQNLSSELNKHEEFTYTTDGRRRRVWAVAGQLETEDVVLPTGRGDDIRNPLP